jgi:hypothetical protein
MSKKSKRKNKFTPTRKLVLNKKLSEAFIHFLEYHPAKRLSKNLRRFFLEYLRHQDVGVSIYFEETVQDLEGLFDLLDIAEEEWTPNPLN